MTSPHELSFDRRTYILSVAFRDSNSHHFFGPLLQMFFSLNPLSGRPLSQRAKPRCDLSPKQHTRTWWVHQMHEAAQTCLDTHRQCYGNCMAAIFECLKRFFCCLFIANTWLHMNTHDIYIIYPQLLKVWNDWPSRVFLGRVWNGNSVTLDLWALITSDPRKLRR